jgi:hypothetical protein
VADDEILWRVEVEIPHWHGWHPLARRRLRRLLDTDDEVVRVIPVVPWLQVRAPRQFPLSILVEVVADGPGQAAKRAEDATARALTGLGRPATVFARIISTDGEEPKRRTAVPP